MSYNGGVMKDKVEESVVEEEINEEDKEKRDLTEMRDGDNGRMYLGDDVYEDTGGNLYD